MSYSSDISNALFVKTLASSESEGSITGTCDEIPIRLVSCSFCEL